MTAADADVEALLAVIIRANRAKEPRSIPALAAVERHEIRTPVGPVYAWRWGEGPATLLVHGLDDDHSLWTPLAQELIERKESFVVLDLPGHGQTPTEEGTGTAARIAIYEVARALGPITRLVAHSFGAGASIGALMDGVTVERAVFIGMPVGGTFGRRRRAIDSGEMDEAQFFAASELFSRRTGRSLAPYDLEWAAAQLSTPVLFIHAKSDMIAPYEHTSRVMDAWPGSTRYVVDEFDHRRLARDPSMLSHVIEFLQFD